MFRDTYIFDMNAVGDATVSVEYDDGSLFIFHVVLEGEPEILAERNPELTVEGTTAIISGLTYVKVVRIAMGTYTTSQDIKLPEGCVNYQQSYIGGADVCSFPLSAEGDISVAVQYNDEKKYLFHAVLTLDEKEHTPACTADGTSITITGLQLNNHNHRFTGGYDCFNI